MADDVSGLSYEAALAELDTIIARLERGDVELEAAISAYQRGAALARHCAALLDRTEQTITQLVVSSAGEQERPLQIAPERAETAPTGGPPGAAGSTPARARSVEQRLFGAAAPQPAEGGPRGAAAIDADDIPF